MSKNRCFPHMLVLFLLGLLVLSGAWFLHSAAWAQPSGVMIQGRPMSPEDMERMKAEAMRRMQEAQANAKAKKEEPKKDEKKDDKGKKDDKPKEEKKDDVKVFKRPTEPPQPPRPEELKAAPDADGLVQFSFQGQRWVDVLQWYADVAKLSFDYQELPGDFLNLTTQRKHTLAETRDLLNRHLLARGFTMLLKGEVLNVVKIDKLDPSLVPRAEADDLEDYAPHDFVRVTFHLPSSLEPAKAAEDVKILLSPNAKVKPLLASKRLLVIDAVANLRDVRDLMYAEQMASDSIIKPREYHIKYRRADYVADQVMVVLGLDPSSRKTPQELQIEQQRMQMIQQLQKKGKDISKAILKEGPQVYIAVNRRNNTLLVNADPEVWGVIERTIKLIDVPGDSMDDTGLATGPLSLKKYQTVTASTESIINALQEIGDLNPSTQLQSDSKSKTIYAYATPADHEKIRKIIDRLDGSGRSATVIWLRRLPADQVAGTIQALFVGEEKKENTRSRRSYYYDYFGRSREPEKEETGFKALADVENNRILLWANESELEEVKKLLVQLGELPSGESANPNKVRVLDYQNSEAAERLLRRLDSAWSGGNRLRIHLPEKEEESKQPLQEKKEPVTPASGKDQLTGPIIDSMFDKMDGNASVRGARLQFAVLRAESEGVDQGPVAVTTVADEGANPTDSTPEKSEAKPADEAPPIDVIVTPDGRIVLRSNDPLALDELENLMSELAPPEPEFHVFTLKNASPYWVVGYLEQYFEEELNGQDEQQFSPWGYYQGGRTSDTGPTTLSKPRLLRFIHDIDTNTIVVQNASSNQLRVIEELIKIYDRPMKEESVSSRHTEAIKIKYSKAADIAVALKEVFRDLLSSKDKEFQGKGQQQSRSSTTYYRLFGGFNNDKEQKKPSAVKIAFEGALSIGVDELSNTLIISTQEEVWENVRQIVERLDEAARPDTVVQVHEVSTLISPAELQRALSKALGEPWPGGKPQQGKAQAGDKGNGKPKEQNGGQNNRQRERSSN